MNMFFSGGSKSLAFNGVYNSKIESAVNDFKANLAYQHDVFLKKGNHSGKLLLPVVIIIALYALGLFMSYRQTYNDSYLGIGIFAGVVTFVFTIIYSCLLYTSRCV